jgi:hypothetical protein
LRISPAYLEEQKRLHADPRGYGARGSKWADEIMEFACTTAIETIVDYGAGQGSLGRELRKAGFDVVDYDPAVDKMAKLPRGPFDLVTCTDVLEHIEEDCLPFVLLDLAGLSELAFIVIGLVETDKKLSDGRQAHINLKPAARWVELLRKVGLELKTEIINRPEKQFVGIFARTL